MNMLAKLPSVDKLLNHKQLQPVLQKWGKSALKDAINNHLQLLRQQAGNPQVFEQMLNKLIPTIINELQQTLQSGLKPVYNATGVVLHTNLGRAPLGAAVLASLATSAGSYTNLEFDLSTGERGSRHSHTQNLLSQLTGAQSALVLNNNAAGVLAALSALAGGKQVVVSRGELVEIGGSFRIPEVITAGGAILAEIGTTNRTHLKDYANAINPQTGAILKVHRSNYYVGGFTAEVELGQLAQLAHSHNLPLVYDLGSGLLNSGQYGLPVSEPDVVSALQAGADVVCFSGDKLLGGPQAGIIVGAKKWIDIIAKLPLLRALRPGKLTIAALQQVLLLHLAGAGKQSQLPLQQMLNQTELQLKNRATELANALKTEGIDCQVVTDTARCGGGTLPQHTLESYSVCLLANKPAKSCYHSLLKLEQPIVGVLKQGQFYLNVFTLPDLPTQLAKIIATALKQIQN